MTNRHDVAIVGGCGRAGLPLGLAFAAQGLQVALLDRREDLVDAVNASRMPYVEPGAAELLADVVGAGRITATVDDGVLSGADHVVIVIGTPVLDRVDQGADAVLAAIDAMSSHLRDGQLVVIRSTVPPGTTAAVERRLAELGLAVDVACCPERVAEGRALAELADLPQIVASRTERGRARATALFGHVVGEVVPLEPEEAELAKLFANAWRYVGFAAANEFFTIADRFGVDYARVREAIRFHYPRGAELPSAGFVGGACLPNDTGRLGAAPPGFALGDASIGINEGLPAYVVARIEEAFALADLTVGILGMAFKAGSDDVRASPSYDLKRILERKARVVLCTDPYVTVDPDLLPLDSVLARADLLVVGAPHSQYADLVTDLPVVDIWNSRRDTADGSRDGWISPTPPSWLPKPARG